MSGAVITRMVWDHLDKKLPGYGFKQAALDPRWVPNQADEHESVMIQGFRAKPSLATQEGLVSRKGEPFYYFATRRTAQKGCLQCHGSAANAPKDQLEIYGGERGYNWKEGEVNVAFVVYVPVGEALAEARSNALRLLAVAGTTLAVAIAALWLLLDRSVVKPVLALTSRTETISLGENLDEKITTSASGEIETLAQAIERLRVSIVKVVRRSNS
jgi:methyl-accepting chemotaxis protein